MGPGRSLLAVQHDVIRGNLIGLEDQVTIEQRRDVIDSGTGEHAIDRPIANDMGNVDALWAEFTSHGLRNRTQAILRRSKSCQSLTSTDARRGTGEDNGALLARDHHIGGFATGQKSRQTRHFPHLGENPRRGFADAELYIGPDVENDDAEWSDIPLNRRKERDRFLLRPRIDAVSMGFAPRDADGLNQHIKLLQIAGTARDADRHALSGEGASYGAADAISRSNDQTHFLGQDPAPIPLRCAKAIEARLLTMTRAAQLPLTICMMIVIQMVKGLSQERDFTMPIAMVTGASTGIGKAAAEALARSGYRVFGTSRSARSDGPAGVEMVVCDVTYQDSLDRLVAHVLAEAGQIDLVVNNAGLGLVGGAEESTVTQVQALFDVNF